MKPTEDMFFKESPMVRIASNTLVNVPIILMYDDTPLIEVVRQEDASYTTKVSIQDLNGVCLAVAKGTQLYETDGGRDAGLTMRHPGKETICERNGKILFTLRRTHAAALKMEASLSTPDGIFIKTARRIRLDHWEATDVLVIQFASGGAIALKGFDIRDGDIGIHLRKDGTLRIGTNCQVRQSWDGSQPSPSPNLLFLQMKGPGPLSNIIVAPPAVTSNLSRCRMNDFGESCRN